MAQNSLGPTIRWVLLVCSLFVMFSQFAHAEQHAILVGVWDYANPNLQLEAPPNDLKLMEAVLSAHGVTQEQMHILTNPNKAQIQRKFRELSRRLTPSDSLLFYFSGHGTQIIDKLGTFPGDEAKGRYPDRNDEALLPVDANLASPKTYLLDDELNILLQELPTRKVSCIIDTCYSGDILREIRLGRPKGTPVTDTPTAIVQRTQTVSHTEDILDESADFALLLAAAAYNQVVHELRIPIGKTYLPVSAMTYSLYRRVFSRLLSPANQAIGVRWHDKLTYRQLVQHVQNDHKQWNLAWQPVLEGPENRFDEVFLPTDLMVQHDKTLTLTTIKGQTVEVSRRALALAGGGNFQLGAASGVNMRHWAVVIGVDAYPPPFQSLKYAADDAKAVAQVFQDAGVNVTLMTPDSLIQPTKANVIEQLQRHAQLEAVDLLTVYLSGHGENVDGTGYFLPMDVTDPLVDNGLSLENLFAILNRANAKHRFVIVDACRVAPKEHFVAALSRYSEESNIIFTACDSNQWAPEVPRLKHGLFTYFLLKGLSGGYQDRGAAGADGTVTVLGLLDYVTRGIEDWHSHLSEELRYPQQITPRIFYNGKYISLLNNQGIDPTVLNNEGLPPRITQVPPPQPTRDLEPFSPLEKDGGVVPRTAKDSDLHLPVTISLIPWISTVGVRALNRNVTTNLSLNIIAGYHTKLDGIELGGVLNMKGLEARGAQFAGVGNIVGGNVDGFQVSTGFNTVGRNVEGFQASGGLNAIGGDLDGFQAAVGVNAAGGSVRGIQAAIGGNFAARNFQGLQIAYGLNLVGENVLSRGLQAAIGANIAGRNVEGFQASVGLNVSGGNLDGFQVVGGGNVVGGGARGVQAAVGGNLVARDLRGWQAAGGLNFVGGNVQGRSLQTAVGGNITGHLEGMQLSLISNIALGWHQNAGISTAGTQISMVNIAPGGIGTQIGLLNIAGHVGTSQVGLLNVSRRMSGIPIGLISFVRDNPLHLQLWGSDTEVANLGIRLGSRHVYSLFVVGSYPHGDLGRWSWGFGMGGHIPLGKRLFLNVDATIRPVLYTDDWDWDDWWEDEHSLLNKLRFAVGWEQHKWFSVFGGISLNLLVSDRQDTSDFGYGFGHVVRPDDVDVTICVWPGFFAGVQF